MLAACLQALLAKPIMKTKIIIKCPNCTQANEHVVDPIIYKILEGKTNFTKHYKCPNVNCRQRYAAEFVIGLTVRGY